MTSKKFYGLALFTILYYCPSGFKVLTLHNHFPIHYFSYVHADRPQDAVSSELTTLTVSDSSIPWQSGGWRDRLPLKKIKNILWP